MDKVNGHFIKSAIGWILQNTCDEGVNTGLGHDLSPFYLHGSTLILAWIIDYIHYKLWNEITYPFLNFNSCNRCSLVMDK